MTRTHSKLPKPVSSYPKKAEDAAVDRAIHESLGHCAHRDASGDWCFICSGSVWDNKVPDYLHHDRAWALMDMMPNVQISKYTNAIGHEIWTASSVQYELPTNVDHLSLAGVAEGLPGLVVESIHQAHSQSFERACRDLYVAAKGLKVNNDGA